VTEIGPGGITKRRGQGFAIAPGESRVIDILVTVSSDELARFDRPDASGRYHPVIMEARFVYFFAGFDLFGILDLPPFYEAAGVVPLG